MASSITTTALQVNFDSVLGIEDNAEMVNMFKALDSTGLMGFLGCQSVLYEQELEQFFDTALVQDNDITGVVSGKNIAITEDRFAGLFGFPTEGLVDISEVPKDLMYDARRIFSKSGEPVSTSCKKRLLKYEFRLLNDILAKSITVKAGYFDAVTHERFLMMTAIHFRIKVNWSKILFGVLKEMVDKTLKRAKGFAAQIYVLLKGDPAVTLGDATTFPPLKILSAKTVQTYVATNEAIDARGKSDESGVVKVASVKKKSVHKKKSAPTDDEPAVVVAEKAVSKKQPATEADVPVETVAEREIEISVDTVDQIIEQILADTKQFEMGEELEIDMGDQGLTDVGRSDMVTEGTETDVGEQMETSQDAYFVEEPIEETESLEGTEIAAVKQTANEKISADEAMTLEEILLTIPCGCSLPSTTGEVTKIQFGKSITIRGVDEGNWYKASLPKIPAADKGKAPLQEKDPIKGNPTKEIFSLTIADIDLLVQLLEQVIDEVDRFFNYFSFKKLAALKLEEIFAKEELVLTWAETDSTKVALQRRTYILLKYRELLLRKFLEALLVPVRPVLRDTSIFDSAVQLAPISTSTDTVFFQIEYQHSDSDSSSSSHDLMDFHVSSPMDEEFVDTSADGTAPDPTQISLSPSANQLSLPVATNVSASFVKLRASISRLVANQTRDSRKLGDSHGEVMSKINHLERALLDSLAAQDQAFRGLIKNIRQEAHNDTDVLSLALKAVRAQNEILSTDLVDVRKEVKDQKELFKEMEERLATVRSELLDFRAQAQENHLNMSTQLGFLVDYINRGGHAKKGEGGSSHPQPPPDDQSRPSGGSASRSSGGSGGSTIKDDRGGSSHPQPPPDDQSRPSGGSASRSSGGSGGSTIKDDRGSGSKKRHSSGGSGGGSYGPYGPYKRDAKYWILGENQF
ncbi:hypothetical protein F511_23312 [Dorcoceras hygrometricum]|uniref:Dystroglycan-like n=1 Tax=Dorcoceras hygrometricum TaxID=472368 RepID=A0A2Z7B8Y0_9LAMI|nr:hypothetical protein F511_23312 [Dorcoceras hygrometricum]